MDKYLSEYFSHSLAPVLTITLVAVVILLFERWLSRFDPGALQKHLGAGGVSVGLFLFFSIVWMIAFVMLFFGLCTLVWSIILATEPTRETVWNWRFSLANLTALIGVLAAVVALPLTMIRLRLSSEQNTTSEDALLNDKINTAVSSLYAQRQITKWENGKAENGWEDDIVRRIGAIDRLEGLVKDHPQVAGRVSRMLSAYVRELANIDIRESIPQRQSEAETFSDTHSTSRPDVEKAVQTLGKIPKMKGVIKVDAIPGLRKACLRGFDLSNLCFDHADFVGVDLEGAILIDSSFINAEFVSCDLTGVEFGRTDMRGALLYDVKFSAEAYLKVFLAGAVILRSALRYGDLAELERGSVLLHVSVLQELLSPVTIYSVAAHANKTYDETKIEMMDHLNLFDAETEEEIRSYWRAWQKEIGFDPVNPDLSHPTPPPTNPA